MIMFKTKSGDVFPIATSVLQRYPTSFLSTMAFSSFKGDHENGFINISSITNDVMSVIIEFYYTGMWKNPYLYENFWSIPECGNSLEDKCLFLGLPYCVEEDEDEEENEDERLWGDMCFEDEELEITKNEFYLEKELEKIEKEKEEVWRMYCEEEKLNYNCFEFE